MKEVMATVADLMALSARTAPKAAGKDFVEIKVIKKGDELDKLADDMIKYGEESGKKNFDRDADNVRNSDVVVLIALNKPKTTGLNCGACGYPKCLELEKSFKEGSEFDGPACAWRVIDLGIAIGSAVKTASILNADNRIMYRIGVSAKRMKLVEGQVVVGIPISATGKSIYFDRKS